MTTNRNRDFSFTNALAPKAGRLLLSDPFSTDAYFERSVVYLCGHGDEGSFGFVLNNFFEIDTKQLNELFPGFMTEISVGGPVETESLYFLHTLADAIPDGLDVGRGIYMGGDFEKLNDLLKPSSAEKGEIRLFIGYSGWDAGQLEAEIAENAWVVVEPDSTFEIMTAGKDSWKYFMEKLGGKYKLMSNFPVDPSEN